MCCSPVLHGGNRGSLHQYTIYFQVLSQSIMLASVNAVTDMFYDLPFGVEAADEQCFQYWGVHTHYNWAATK